MKMLSSSSETIIFMFLGVATVNDSHDWNTWFVVLTIFFCSVFRVLGVILLTAVVNRFRLYKLNKVEKFVMSYGGLRGAVAFALVLLIDPKHVRLQPMFVTTTIAVIYFTVFFQGITIKPLVKILNVKRAEKRKPSMNERIHERIMDHVMAGIEDILGHHGNHHLRDKAGHAVRMEESRTMFIVLTGEPNGKRPFGGSVHKWENNIRMGLKEMGCNEVRSKLVPRLSDTDSAVTSNLAPRLCDRQRRNSSGATLFLYAPEIFGAVVQ
uniref:Cation/H+ exchanger transmembrane domain-containing protein n=1 Tax=Timema douglasi TaxID=61478 RepID=A0A7R8VBM7_TIMDO|nr:unnamed protein product [Timema douglasi]